MFTVWIKLHKFLIVESSPFLHETSNLTYRQEKSEPLDQSPIFCVGIGKLPSL